MQTGIYVTRNDTYNKALANGLLYTSTINAPTDCTDTWHGSFQWDWPLGLGGVKNYANFWCGLNPWRQELPSTVDWLPVRLDSLPTITAEIDNFSEVSADSSFDTSFDIWLTAEDGRIVTDVVAEVMIWTNHQAYNVEPASSKAGQFTVGGRVYDLYVQQYPHWQFFVFVDVNTMQVGTVPVSQLLTLLVSEGYLADTLWLGSVAFGNEVVCGSGKTTINRFKLAAG